MDEYNQKTVDEILDKYVASTENYREAMRLASVPDALVEVNLTYLPNFKRMIPEDVVKFYHDLREKVILYFYELGFSRRSIGRIVAHDNYYTVVKTIKKHTPKIQGEETTISLDEVKR